MLNISFFGASVTAQKTGYVHYFCEAFNQDYKEANISQHGYGSMDIRTAGICYIDDILRYNPSYCFIDWFSTTYIAKEQELLSYLDNFRYKFINNDCQIIFLLFGGNKSHMSDIRLIMYDQVIAYAKQHEIPYINIYEQIKNEEEKQLYKDSVHTLDFGASIYGNNIYKEFIKNILNKKINKKNLIKNKFAEIKKKQIQKEKIENFIKIKGSGEIFGICQNIGPYSGIVNIDADGELSKQKIWDTWCYYERKHLKIQKSFNHYLNIFISQEDFDRSSAKQQVDWSLKKIIKPIDFIYYIGDIENIEIK
jgi:hypothetical protein